MIEIKPFPLSFTTSLGCADCRKHTSMGLVYGLLDGSWQLVPLCADHLCEPVPGEAKSPAALRYIDGLRRNARTRKQKRATQMYTQLRREHASVAQVHRARRTLKKLYEREEAEQ